MPRAADESPRLHDRSPAAILERTSQQPDVQPLGSLLERFEKGFPPPKTLTPSESPLAPDHLRIVSDSDLLSYRFAGGAGYLRYEEIEEGFEQRRQLKGGKNYPVHRETLDSDLKLLISENRSHLRAAITTERIYPS